MGKSTKYETEEALLRGLKNEERAAFEHLYRNGYPMAVKQVSEAGFAPEDAEDLFQEALLVLVKNVHKPDFTLTAKLSTYLFAIVRNLLLKKRTQKTPGALDESKLGQMADNDTEENSADRKIWESQLNVVVACLELLEDNCNQLLRMSFFEQRSHAEIAAALGYSEAFVKVKKHRCLDYLRNKVKSNPLFQRLSNDLL